MGNRDGITPKVAEGTSASFRADSTNILPPEEAGSWKAWNDLCANLHPALNLYREKQRSGESRRKKFPFDGSCYGAHLHLHQHQQRTRDRLFNPLQSWSEDMRAPDIEYPMFTSSRSALAEAPHRLIMQRVNRGPRVSYSIPAQFVVVTSAVMLLTQQARGGCG